LPFVLGVEAHIVELAYLNADRLLVGGFGREPIQVWDLADGKQLVGFGGEMTANLIAISADGETAVTVRGESFRSGRFWIVTTGIERAEFWEAGPVSAIACSPTGGYAAVGSKSGLVTIRDAASGASHGAFEWGLGPITSLAFSPDGLLCAASDATGRIVVWDLDAP
jgi:WD40 repeat protein